LAVGGDDTHGAAHGFGVGDRELAARGHSDILLGRGRAVGDVNVHRGVAGAPVHDHDPVAAHAVGDLGIIPGEPEIGAGVAGGQALHLLETVLVNGALADDEMLAVGRGDHDRPPDFSREDRSDAASLRHGEEIVGRIGWVVHLLVADENIDGCVTGVLIADQDPAALHAVLYRIVVPREIVRGRQRARRNSQCFTEGVEIDHPLADDQRLAVGALHLHGAAHDAWIIRRDAVTGGDAVIVGRVRAVGAGAVDRDGHVRRAGAHVADQDPVAADAMRGVGVIPGEIIRARQGGIGYGWRLIERVLVDRALAGDQWLRRLDRDRTAHHSRERGRLSRRSHGDVAVGVGVGAYQRRDVSAASPYGRVGHKYPVRKSRGLLVVPGEVITLCGREVVDSHRGCTGLRGQASGVMRDCVKGMRRAVDQPGRIPGIGIGRRCRACHQPAVDIKIYLHHRHVVGGVRGDVDSAAYLCATSGRGDADGGGRIVHRDAAEIRGPVPVIGRSAVVVPADADGVVIRVQHVGVVLWRVLPGVECLLGDEFTIILVGDVTGHDILAQIGVIRIAGPAHAVERRTSV